MSEVLVEGATDGSGESQNPFVVENDTCVAFRLHNTFFEGNFTHEANLSELVALQVVPYLAIMVAVTIGAVGYKILRAAVVILGFCVGSMAALHVFYEYATLLHNWNCDAVVAASFSFGGVLGMVGATLVNTVSMVLGFLAGGAFCILLFDICLSCNDALWLNAPTLLGKSLIPFWLTFGVCGLIGGAVCKRQDTRILAFVTSVIGGWGASVGIRLAASAQDAEVPSWSGLLLTIGLSGAGFGLQTWMLTRGTRLWKNGTKTAVAATTEAAENRSL
jgi:hypothetical protein